MVFAIRKTQQTSKRAQQQQQQHKCHAFTICLCVCVRVRVQSGCSNVMTITKWLCVAKMYFVGRFFFLHFIHFLLFGSSVENESLVRLSL